MIPTPFGIAATKGAGTALSSVNLMSVKPLLVQSGSVDWETQNIALTGTTGHLVVMFLYTTQVASPAGINNVAWDGSALTELEDAGWGQAGGACGWAGWIRGGSVDGTLVITAGAVENRDVIGWVLSFDRLAASPVGASEISPVHVEQGAHSIAITATNAISRVYGVVGAVRSNMFPFLVNDPPWTLVDHNRTGTSGSGDMAAVLASMPAGTAGLKTLTGTTTSGLTTNDWCSLAVEVLPA